MVEEGSGGFPVGGRTDGVLGSYTVREKEGSHGGEGGRTAGRPITGEEVLRTGLRDK